jgi:hypothetical protein
MSPSPFEIYLIKPVISRVRSLRSPLRALDIPDFIMFAKCGEELIWAAETAKLVLCYENRYS